MKNLAAAVQARWLVVVVAVVAAFASSAWLAQRLPKVYEARASFYVPIVQDVFSLTTETGGAMRAVPAPTVVRDQLRGYFGILSSQRVAASVAATVPERLLWQINKATRFRLTSAGMFLITVSDKDPAVAARIANTYADSFNDLFEEISLPRAKKTRTFIEDQLQKVQVSLIVAEEQLGRFKKTYRTVSLAEETSENVKRAKEARAQFDLAKVALEELRTRIRVLKQGIATEAQLQLSSQVITTNPQVQQLQARLNDLEVERAGLLSRFTSLHPEVIKRQRQIDEAKKLLQEEVQRLVSGETHSLNPVYENLRQNLVTLYADERALGARLAGLQGIVQKLDAELEQLPDVQRRLAGLTRVVRHLEDTDRTLAQKLEDARIQEKREIQTFLVVDRAVAPEHPTYPNALLSVPAAVTLAAVLTSFYSAFLGYFARRRSGGI